MEREKGRHEAAQWNWYKLGGKMMKFSSEMAFIGSELGHLLSCCITFTAVREAESKPSRSAYRWERRGTGEVQPLASGKRRSKSQQWGGSSSPSPLSFMPSPAGNATFKVVNLIWCVGRPVGYSARTVCQENNNPNGGYLRPAVSACTAESLRLRILPGA